MLAAPFVFDHACDRCPASRRPFLPSSNMCGHDSGILERATWKSPPWVQQNRPPVIIFNSERFRPLSSLAL